MERKRKIKNLIIGLIVALAAAAMALLPMFLSSGKAEPEDKASILSAVTERRDIRSTISGGGTLTDQEGIAVTVPHGVEITEYLVRNGDSVEQGQSLCRVDKVSVMSTIATVQENLEHLQNELRLQGARAGAATLTAPANGRVKAVYAEKGDKVADVVEANGALCVISLDGLMAVTAESDSAPAAGSEVTVSLPDGKSYPGRVEQSRRDSFTVTLTDNGPALGAEAVITDETGAELGRGELFVHSAWNLVASSGRITGVNVKPETPVYYGNYLFYLENMDSNGAYDALAMQHRDYEDAMLRLFELYNAGTVPASADGRVQGIDEARLGLMRAGEKGWSLHFLADPGDTSAAEYVNKPAMVTKIAYGSITFTEQKEPETLSDYLSQPDPDLSASETHVIRSFSGVTIFDYDKDAQTWKTIYAGDLREGDLLWFAYDPEGNLVWIIRPVKQEDMVIPDVDPGGYYGGPEEPFVMYDLTETELLQVVPQETMTVKVSVDELDILAVAVGQEAEITVDALPGRAFTGTVSHIDPNGVNQGGNTKYTVTIAIDRDEAMLAGMNATAIMTVGVTENVLTLPAEALTEKGSRTVVYTGYDPQNRLLLAPVEVETGVSDGAVVEIVTGLEEGTPVWYKYYETEGAPDLFAGLPGESA